MSVFSLPMYDWPEVQRVTDAWAAALSKALRKSGFSDVPSSLRRSADFREAWLASDLLLSQACGYVIPNEFADRLVPVITPHYGVEGCEGPNYSSFIFVRIADKIRNLGDLRGGIAVYNNRDSMSGMLALKLMFAPLAENGIFFSGAFESGAHIGSLIAVQEGVADVCAIDAVCVALAKRYRPSLLDGLEPIAQTPLVPGLPYVTQKSKSLGERAKLRAVLAAVFSDPELQPVRSKLFISGYSVLDADAYVAISDIESDIGARGGLRLLNANVPHVLAQTPFNV